MTTCTSIFDFYFIVSLRIPRCCRRQNPYVHLNPPALKVVLITGGDGNIGMHISMNVARAGATTVLVCHSADKCSAAVATIASQLAALGITNATLATQQVQTSPAQPPAVNGPLTRHPLTPPPIARTRACARASPD